MGVGHYRGTSLTRKGTPLGPYRRPMPRVVGGLQGGGHFLMGEVPLYTEAKRSSEPFHVTARCPPMVELNRSHGVTSLIRKRNLPRTTIGV